MLFQSKKIINNSIYNRIIIVVLISGVILRLILALNQNSIWYDQALYCHEAQKIINGQLKYINTNENNFYTLQKSGLSTFNHPLYPIVIALFSLGFGNIELSGTIISFVSNILMLYFLFLMCNYLMDKKWAICVLGICCFHPALILISASKYAESLYMLFIILTAYAVLQFHHQRRMIYLVSSGFVLGCAYLTKPEVSILIPYFSLIIIFSSVSKKLPNLRHTMFSLLTFFLPLFMLIFPYILYLRITTGQWQFSQKFLYNMIVAERLEKMNYKKAFWELNAEATDTILSEMVSKDNFWGLLKSNYALLIRRSIVNNFKIIQILLPLFFKYKTLLFILLLSVSFVIVHKSKKNRSTLIWLILFLFAQSIPYSITLFLTRPLAPLIPIMTVLLVYSISQIVTILPKKLQKYEDCISCTIIMGGICYVLIYSTLNLSKQIQYVRSYTYAQEVGKWLNQNTYPNTILMAQDPEIPYYAKRDQVILPVGSEENIFYYGKLKSARYLVQIDQETTNHQSFLPDKFSLIKKFAFPGRKVLIYKLLYEK